MIFLSLKKQAVCFSCSFVQVLNMDPFLDALVNQIALVLRMLYISDFRELQNEVNDLIVLGQEYTANP
jgi:hypothetical protein